MGSYFKKLALVLGLLLPLVSFGPDEKELHKYNVISTQFRIIPPGAYVEGSDHFGGLQPEYFIDMESPEIRKLIAYGERLKAENFDLWTKVDRITAYMRKYVLPNREYTNPRYLSLLKKYRVADTAVPLSKYIQCKSGVCREYSMLTHILLKAAGIPNFHVYAKVRQAAVDGEFDFKEDHGFAVIKHRGHSYVVDPYNENFHRFKLADLESREGITEDRVIRQVLQIHDYPVMWVPKTDQCAFRKVGS